MHIQFEECLSVKALNISLLKISLSRWINEECALAIVCNMGTMLNSDNIVIDQVHCGPNSNYINLAVVKNASKSITVKG